MHNNEPQGAFHVAALGKHGIAYMSSCVAAAAPACVFAKGLPGDVTPTVRLPAGAALLPAAADGPYACSPPPPATLLAARTHRELFSIWYADLLKEPLEELLAVAPRPAAAERFFHQMMRDINGACQDPVDQVGCCGGWSAVVPLVTSSAIGRCGGLKCGLQVLSSSGSRPSQPPCCPLPHHPHHQACYAMGYNLAIEYLADYEKTWMLDSFRALNERVLAPAGRPLTEWVFLEVRRAGGVWFGGMGGGCSSGGGVLGAGPGCHGQGRTPRCAATFG